MIRTLFLIGCLGLALLSCQPETSPDEYNAKAGDPELLHQTSEKLTDVIIHDIFKPPVASRIYGYTYLAAYEALQPAHENYQSLGGQLNGFTAPPAPDSSKVYCFPLASAKAFIVVARALTFSGNMWDDYEKTFWEKYKAMGIPKDVFDRSVAYGELVAKHVLDYTSKDNYKQIRGFRYTVTNEPGTWVPTPPAYADACEPMWNTIRTFVLDSARHFRCPPPAVYSLNEKSEFMKLVKEVYEIGKNLTEEQKTTAYFWDDNAFVTNIVGHVTFANKKMTPPGHWMAIIRNVSRDRKLSMIEALEAHVLGASAIYDGFISVWDEKYSSVRIRPETVINNHMDPDWRPYLETPAFPEYVSGHSGISAACGRVLTHLMGNNVAFTDSTEYKYGHGVKSFASFEEAYWDCSISRVYGGIHYRDGVEEGTRLGEKIGDLVWERLKTRKKREDLLSLKK